MTLGEVARLIHEADARHHGCSVTLYTINDPASSRGTLIGHVTRGRSAGSITFETERGLIAVLRRLTK